jgi:hypothetical protein
MQNDAYVVIVHETVLVQLRLGFTIVLLILRLLTEDSYPAVVQDMQDGHVLLFTLWGQK